jgi:hypothetical protein
MGSRSRRLIQQSRALVDKSRARIARAQRRVVHAIRGGSTPLIASPTSRRRRIEILPPRVWAGPADGSMRCAICAKTIPKDSIEYELVSVTGHVVVDRRCFVIWQNVLNRLERRRLGR